MKIAPQGTPVGVKVKTWKRCLPLVSLSVVVVVAGCGGNSTSSSQRSEEEAVSNACRAMCAAMSSANCGAAQSTEKCIAGCIKESQVVPACINDVVAASECFGRLSPDELVCQGSVATTASERACQSEDSAWKTCVARNVTPNPDCKGVCEKLYSTACPNDKELATCLSNCDYPSPVFDACAAELDTYYACLIEQPVGVNACTNGQPDLVKNCQTEIDAFAACARAN